MTSWSYLKLWWRGELRDRRARDILRPRSLRILYVIGRTVKGFWLREWKWVIGALLGVGGLILAYLRLGK